MVRYILHYSPDHELQTQTCSAPSTLCLNSVGPIGQGAVGSGGVRSTSVHIRVAAPDEPFSGALIWHADPRALMYKAQSETKELQSA